MLVSVYSATPSSPWVTLIFNVSSCHRKYSVNTPFPCPTGFEVLFSSSLVIYILGPLYCGKKKRGEPFFCFPSNCISPDTLTCIISMSRKKDFLPLLFKNKISRESKRSLELFSLQTMFTLGEGPDEKHEQVFSSGGEGHFGFLKENSKALINIIQPKLWWILQKGLKAFSMSLWGAGSGLWQWRGPGLLGQASVQCHLLQFSSVMSTLLNKKSAAQLEENLKIKR